MLAGDHQQPIREHRRHSRPFIPVTNLLERTFGGDAPPHQGYRPAPWRVFVPKLIWAVLDRPSRSWRGLAYTPAATRLLQDLSHELFTPHIAEPTPDSVTTAA